ncbi:hypothetical protein [Klebsiella variicola]|uniref:hypothetical protein n=1 Tax=Klebsiella variicola TaxID=244366 RepID=UPI003D07397B
MPNQTQPSEELRIEAIRWHQKLQEIIYLEAGQHMRALNQLMWQIPSFVIAVNGGLWYATTLANENSLWIIFLVLALFDATTIVTLFRLRHLIGTKIIKQKEIEDPLNNPVLKEISFNCGFNLNPHPQKKQKSYIVVFCWTIMLLACLTVNVLGCFSPTLLSKQNKEQSYRAIIKKNGDEIVIEARTGDQK